MFSQSVEYALRAMVCLAQAAPASQATGAIAEISKIPPAYLVKILQQLNRSGLIHSQRGINGGVSLAKAPEKISILEIINAVEPMQRILKCPLGLPEHARKLCALHAKMDSALAAIETSFAESFLSDMVETRKKTSQGFPHATKN